MTAPRKYEEIGWRGKRLSNDRYLRGRNFQNTADVNMFKVNEDDEIETPMAPRVTGKGLLAIASPGVRALERFLAHMSLVQNNDGGWDFYQDIAGETLRNPASVSPGNQFGTQPRIAVEAWSLISNPAILKTAKTPLDSSLAIVVHPSTNRMYIDRVMALIVAGKSATSNPLAFTSYFTKGLDAFKAEIDFYKAIQVWHNDGNPANPNPPTAQITTIIDTRPADVNAIPMSQAARRLMNRFNFIRSTTPNLIPYDAFARIEVAVALDGQIHDGENIRVFGLEIAKIIRDENFPVLDFGAYYCIQGLASSARIFAMFKNDSLTFEAARVLAINDLMARIIPSGPYAGWYALTTGIDINDLNTYIAGDKADQGQAILALLENEELIAARDLANKLIEIQSNSGQFVDIFDIAVGEMFYQEASGNCALGVLSALKMGII